MSFKLPLQALMLLGFLMVTAGLSAEPIRVAVAANFYPVMGTLVEQFQSEAPISDRYQVDLITGSSGKLASQILSGAPIDLFLSADSQRPRLLEEKGVVVDSRTTYALGRLAVVMQADLNEDEEMVVQLPELSLALQDKRVAVANPKLAPYGAAALQSMEVLGLTLDSVVFVYGENVSQVFHFFDTGNVDAAFVSMSQVLQTGISKSAYLEMPSNAYDPIRQQMVLLNERQEVRALYEYLLSDSAQSIIAQLGYKEPVYDNTSLEASANADRE